jgi:hypothetical protein
MTKRLLLILILLVSIVLSSVACAPSDPPDTLDTETDEYSDSESVKETVAETEAPEESEKKLVLFEDGKWSYRIVTRALRSADEVDFSFGLTTELNALIGSAPHSANDTAIKGEEVNEIIIGYTKHPEMKALYSELGYGEAQIKVKGNKIYIAAYSADGFEELQKHLKKQLKSGKSNGRIELSVKDLETRITVNEALNSIPTANVGSFSCISNCGYGQTLIIIGETSKNDFDSYVESLKDHTCVSSTNESGNAAATFDFGNHILNVSYSKHDNGLRIILNKDSEPTELFNVPEKAEKVCEPMLIMHGLAWRQAGYTYYGYGMCYIIRLSDGRFIVIDGGFNRKKDADDLYALLTKYTPNGTTPTIAMWIITHAHIDHHGTFALQFLSNYRTKVTVENVMFNPPGGGILTDPSNESVQGLMNGHITLNNAIKIYKANNLRSHVGDKYYVGDAVIDVLYTVDYQYPKQFDYYNTSSMILSITIAGQRIMITGDASNDAFDKTVKMYGASLKSDILQPAHHGGNTGVDSNSATAVAEGYKLMSPSVVIWPASDESYESSKKTMFNKALLSLNTLKKVVVAGDRDFIVTLPYNP